MLFLAGALVAFGVGRRRATAAVLSVAVGHFIAMAVVIQGYDHYGQLKSAAAMSKVLPPLGPDSPVFTVRMYDQTLPFYLRRDVVLVGRVCWSQHEPASAPATLDESVARAAAEAPRDAPRHAGRIAERGVPIRVVFEDPRRPVVMKPRQADLAWILGGVANAVAQLLLKAGTANSGEISLTQARPRCGAPPSDGQQPSCSVASRATGSASSCGSLRCRVSKSHRVPDAVDRLCGQCLLAVVAGEDVNAQRWLGIGVIIVGVVLVARSGSHCERRAVSAVHAPCHR